jgi:hypothetical protein
MAGNPGQGGVHPAEMGQFQVGHFLRRGSRAELSQEICLAKNGSSFPARSTTSPREEITVNRYSFPMLIAGFTWIWYPNLPKRRKWNYGAGAL